MVLWRCELRVSWAAQWQSLLIHGAIILLLLLIPWPGSYTLFWIVLLTLVLMESIRSQRRILSRAGPIELLSSGQFRWRQRRWFLVSKPWIGRWAILLPLRSVDGKREWLWLGSDSMENAEWRLLRQHLLMPGKPDDV
ncbi:protein YgfX [Erwinia sp. SLM-02]|uniref:protein YgfX n=1 Tax=Erwinia sp. SLM-02 TaxID=3020057 RepID=UPI0028D3D8B7|nr:protein YgfX [uncultured Erwinia sp.]